MTDFASAIGAIGLKAFSKAGEIALDKYMPKAFDIMDTFLSDRALSSSAKLALKKYQQTSFDRCSHVKTVINRGEKIDLLDIFVNLNFNSSNKIFDIFEFIETIDGSMRITLSGTGGCGKSMVMKYVWLSFFTGSNGKIPIFVELRNYNSLTSVNLRLSLASSLFSGIKVEEAEKIFIKMLEGGKFCFILDGFDEVLDRKKPEVERQIIELSDNYSDNLFVISTRPREHVLSWQRFTNFDVSPLSKRQAIELVSKIEYDSEIKKKFMDSISRDLYEKHESFLSIPLLVNMMLMTFSDLAEFPTRMHVFYEQAFWALFKNHDARKAWSRDQSSGLALEDFESLLSAFCYISNRNQITKFREKDLLLMIKNASSLSQVSVDPDLYMRDLIDNVCILMQDGLDFVFIHRSFQEYFAARFVYFLPESDWLEAVCVLPLYFGEEVGNILYNMNNVKFDNSVMIKSFEKCGFDSPDFSSWLRFISKCESGISLAAYDTGRGKSIGMTYLNINANEFVSVVVYYLNNCVPGRKKFISSTYALGPSLKILPPEDRCGAVGNYIKDIMSQARDEWGKRGGGRMLPVDILNIKGGRVYFRKKLQPNSRIDFDIVSSYLASIGYEKIFSEIKGAVLRITSEIERRKSMQSQRLRRAMKPQKVERLL